ncbi:cell division protein FtsL [Paracoccus sp. TK19116]|uniref:Cell division protein FtsL n=1 Tax=Paracoccus albicereus TaxID=2922394 RepID=A0ABT1MR63_9RHOB|nr:cell division protein FtsL [Paracoccus albicereus]MCQ0970798.1 cell division protein FtsL [Paracoccus albicereus]
MKTLVYLACILTVMGLAFWAYRENYRTQASLEHMRDVQRDIATLREDLGVLRAEWAYLNRPDRLRELVALNFDKLRLVPVDSGQFVGAGQIDYAKPPAPPEPDATEDETATSEEQQP